MGTGEGGLGVEGEAGEEECGEEVEGKGGLGWREGV